MISVVTHAEFLDSAAPQRVGSRRIVYVGYASVLDLYPADELPDKWDLWTSDTSTPGIHSHRRHYPLISPSFLGLSTGRREWSHEDWLRCESRNELELVFKRTEPFENIPLVMSTVPDLRTARCEVAVHLTFGTFASLPDIVHYIAVRDNYIWTNPLAEAMELAGMHAEAVEFARESRERALGETVARNTAAAGMVPESGDSFPIEVESEGGSVPGLLMLRETRRANEFRAELIITNPDAPITPGTILYRRLHSKYLDGGFQRIEIGRVASVGAGRMP